MPIQNPMEQKEKIVQAIKTKGPSLPVHIASATGLNSIFAGAFLSELFADKTIKISHMKVGGSPLYYLPGQEELLESYFQHLNSKEKEAFLLLKDKQLLEDAALEPAIRVALRNLKDFAYPIAPIVEDKKVLFWRFHSTPEEQAKEEIEKIITRYNEKPIEKEHKEKTEEHKVHDVRQEIEKKQELLVKTEEIKELKVEEAEKPKKHKQKKIIEKEITLLDIPERPKIEQKSIEKPEFVNQILKFLETENIELLEEREFKKKDYLGIVRINSDLGKIKFLLVAKQKKSISDSDLIQALEKIQAEKLPILFIAPGILNKKAKEYQEKYSSLIKFKQI